jgi:ATP-dependent protease ClpP protease subunit
MGAVLLQAGDRRVMGRNATLLIHEAHVSLAGEVTAIEDAVAQTRTFNRRCLDLLAARSNMTAIQIEWKWKRKQWWIDAPTALDHGFVDEIR